MHYSIIRAAPKLFCILLFWCEILRFLCARLLRCNMVIADFPVALTRGGVEDTRLEAKAKDTKKIRGQGQGQPFRGQTLSRPRTGMLEAKDQGHKARVLSKKKKKKKVFTKIFQAISKKKKKKVFTKIFQAISKKKKKKKKKKGLHKNFSSDLHEKTLSKKFFNRSTKF